MGTDSITKQFVVKDCAALERLVNAPVKCDNKKKDKRAYMRNYFADRYGVIRDVDFLPIFEKLLKHESEA